MAVIGRIRKHSGIAVAVIAVAIAAFIIGDVFNRQGQGSMNIAKINGEDISYMEFDAKVQEQENLYKNQTQKLQVSNEELYMIRESAWNQIYEGRILDKEYKALGLTVSAAEVNDMFMGEFLHPQLRQVFTDPSTGEYNLMGVTQTIANFDNLDEEMRRQWIDMERFVKEDRLNTKYNNLISQGFYTPKALTEVIAKLQSKTVSTRYVAANYSTIPDSEVTITDADYKKYYDSHKEEYKNIETTRDIEFVIFPVNPTPEDLMNIQNDVYKTFEEFQTISNDEMIVFVNSESDTRFDSTFRAQGYFEEPIDSIVRNSSVGTFIEPVNFGNEWRMGKILKVENRPDSLRASTILILNSSVGGEITRTNDEAKQLADSLMNTLKSTPFLFDQFVATYSDDPQKAENNGDMGWALDGGYGFFNEKIIETPVGGMFIYERPDGLGYHIVHVTGKTTPKRKASVAMVTRDIEASDRTSKDIYARANKFASDSRTRMALQENAQKEGLMVRSADYTQEMSSRLPGLNSAREIVRWAFNKDTKAGDVAAEIFESDGSFVVATLKDIRPAGYAALEQIKPQIESMVKTEKRAEIMLDKVSKVLANTKDISTIASQLNTTVETIESTSFGEYYFGGAGAEMKVLGSLPNAKANSLLGPIKGYNGVYVLQIDNVTENPPAGMEMIAQQMNMMNQQKSMIAIQILKEHTKLKDNRAMFY